MRSVLYILAVTCALFVGGLTWTDTAEARPWRSYYRAPVARYYSYQPYYYGYRPYYYQPYYYSYRPYYYGYRTYYGSPYYYRPYIGGRVYYYR